MDDYMFSFTLFAIPANIIAGLLYVGGRQKAGLLNMEYPFIYLPWLTLQALTWGFFGMDEIFANDQMLQAFIVVLQSVACGVLAGFILLPRFYFPAESTAEKLRITCISAAIFSAVYAFTRILLFSAIRMFG